MEEVNPKQFKKLDLFNVSEIKKQKGGCIEIKFFDRLKALSCLENFLNSENDEPSFYDAILEGAQALENEDEGN